MAPKVTYPDGTNPKICIIGAGVSGLCAAIQLKRILGIANFILFERADDVGGVWLANKYPGCRVDSFAWFYSFSFAQNPGWTEAFPCRDEFLAYLRMTAEKYEIYSNIRFNTAVNSCSWNQDSGTWTVTTNDAKEQIRHEFDIVIIGTGPHSEPHYPSMLTNFHGPMMHSAKWDSNIELENKVVGVVGSGASALQVIPEIAPKVEKLIVYARDPTYVGPKYILNVGRISKFIFTLFPCILWMVRFVSFSIMEALSSIYDVDSIRGRLFAAYARFLIWLHVKDTNVQQLMTPRYALGFKLPALAYSNYFQTYNQPNVHLYRSGILSVNGQSVRTEDGKTDKLDVLILCTGFKMLDFFAPIRITGVDGVNLLRQWKLIRPSTYYGITCHETPNMFFLQGPNAISGYSSVIFMTECQVTFIINALRQLMKTNSESIQVHKAAAAESMLEISNGERNKVYMIPGPDETCKTNFLDSNGNSTYLWPKSCMPYWLRTRRLNPMKFQFRTRHTH